MHFYITGDTHRSFDRIEDFCYEYETILHFSVFTGIMKHDHGRRKITKKKYGMKELCMWKNSIPIFYLLRMEKFVISMEKSDADRWSI